MHYQDHKKKSLILLNGHEDPKKIISYCHDIFLISSHIVVIASLMGIEKNQFY